jgi:4a-hydroxytetrahydrobiopterin dehydratase
MTDELIEIDEFLQTPGLEDWRREHAGACVCFRTGSLAASAELVQALAALPGTENGRPDIDIRGDAVYVRVITLVDHHGDDYAGLTERDVELALAISAVAQRLELTTDPAAVQSITVRFNLDLDNYDFDQVSNFWGAILGYQQASGAGGGQLVDPRRRGVPLSFESHASYIEGDGSDEDVPIHLHIRMSSELVDARLDAASKFGGEAEGKDDAESPLKRRISAPDDTPAIIDFTEDDDYVQNVEYGGE